MLKPHVVILGAGFGGTYLAKKLAKHVKRGLIDVTIVNKTNYFLFTPLLHEVATGSLSPTSVAEPLREVFVGTGVELCQGSVQSIDLEGHRIHVLSAGNESRHTLPYDYLVIATGAETNYYGISGAEKYTFSLKDLEDAVRIRAQIIDCFEEANMCEDPEERARLLSFVVVGGGPTGVETVGELHEFIHGIVDRYHQNTYSADHKEVKVILVHSGVELLEQFPQPIRTAALKRLTTQGVDVRLGSAVNNVTSHTISLASGESISTATVIWAAGVKPSVLDFVGTNNSGRISVDEYLKINNDERVFAFGDIAGSLPMLAQVAVKQADTVAQNIVSSIKQKKLKSFHFKSQGSLISIGQWFAVGLVFSRYVEGRLAWLIWRTAYLFKFLSKKKRLHIIFEWTLQLIFPRDITKPT